MPGTNSLLVSPAERKPLRTGAVWPAVLAVPQQPTGQLAEHDFLSIWNDIDRRLVAAGLSMAVKDRGPTVIHARGETLAGKHLDLEFALAPLLTDVDGPRRFLGLCQAITPEEILGGRPLRRLQVLAIFPPAPVMRPAIRIVASR